MEYCAELQTRCIQKSDSETRMTKVRVTGAPSPEKDGCAVLIESLLELTYVIQKESRGLGLSQY